MSLSQPKNELEDDPSFVLKSKAEWEHPKGSRLNNRAQDLDDKRQGNDVVEAEVDCSE